MDSVSQREIWFCDPPRGLSAKWLSLRELSAVKSIGDRSFSKRWTESDYSYFITSESGYCFGLSDGKSLVAFILSLLAQGDLDIASIATEPGYRNQGLAKWMLSALNKDQDILRIYLEVDEANTVAQHLYKGNGFVPYGRRKKYYDGQRDAVLMRKVLREWHLTSV